MNPVIISRGDLMASLYLGDCLDIIPTLGRVDAVVTDPPYGIRFASQPTKWQRAKGQQPESWDNTKPGIGLLELVLSKGDEAIVWGGNYFALPPRRCWLSWYKPDAPPSMGNVEFAWTTLDKNSRQISHSISATNAERVGHPTQKPVAVMLWSLSHIPFSKTILDPFAGSATTGIACLRTGRSFIGIEKNPRYFQIAVDRLQREAAQGVLEFENHSPSQETAPLL